MKKLLLALPLMLLLGACSVLQSDNTRVVVGDTFTAYTRLYQPVLIAYSKLPYCGNPAQPPCKDRELYSKLYYADAAAVACMSAAAESLASEAPDLGLITECISQVEVAKFNFVGKNLSTEVTP